MTKEFEEGFESYSIQDLDDNPYPEHSDEWKMWNLGWNRAQEQDPLYLNDEDDDEDEDAEYEYA